MEERIFYSLAKTGIPAENYYGRILALSTEVSENNTNVAITPPLSICIGVLVERERYVLVCSHLGTIGVASVRVEGNIAIGDPLYFRQSFDENSVLKYVVVNTSYNNDSTIYPLITLQNQLYCYKVGRALSACTSGGIVTAVLETPSYTLCTDSPSYITPVQTE